MRGIAVAVVFLVASCSGSSRPSEQDPAIGTSHVAQTANEPGATTTSAVVLSPAGHDPVTVHVEVAADDETRQRGLMFRRHMADDAGMIFLFDEPEHQSFWMHNTYLPLDMIFIREDMSVLGVVENATPQTDDAREVPGESKYVLEVNAGFARRHGIGPGTQVRFDNVANHGAPRGGHAAQ